VEPVSLIVAALAAEGAKTAVSEAVKDAYARVKKRVHELFAGRASGELALAKHAEQPTAWAGALAAELVDAGADQDRAVLEAAQQLLALLDAAGTRSGKYLVNMPGAQGVQVGDHNTQSNTFTTPPAH